MAFICKLDRPKCTGLSGFQIPRNLHFLWGFLGDTGPLPEREERHHDLWQSLNTTWDCDIHTPENLDFALSQPRQRALYAGLPTAIQRCDLARPLLLDEYGGIYSDLDVHPYRTMDDLCSLFPDAGVLLVEEVTLSRARSVRRGNRFPIRQGHPELRLRVANFWMASVPGHPFWQDVLELMEERRHLEIHHDYDIIYTTGPDIITEAYHRTIDRYDDITLVPRRLARSFFRHRTHGSWRTEGRNTSWVA